MVQVAQYWACYTVVASCLGAVATRQHRYATGAESARGQHWNRKYPPCSARVKRQWQLQNPATVHHESRVFTVISQRSKTKQKIQTRNFVYCSLIKRITPNIRRWCLVLINSVLLNLLCVWILLYHRLGPHYMPRFLAPPSKLCQNWLRHWRGTLYFHAVCTPTLSAPSERFGYK